MSIPTRARLARVAPAAIVGALALGLVPAASASAVGPSVPPITYLSTAADATSDKLYTNAADLGAAGDTLTPETYVYSYDVSESGDVLVAGVRSGSFALDPADTTFGVVLTVRTAGPTVTTKVLSSFYDSNPVVLPDGSKVFWMIGGDLYSYDVVAGTGPTLVTSAFAPTGAEVINRLAISPDGLKAAVLFQTRDSNGNVVGARVQAAAFSGAAPAFAKTYATAPFPTSFTFSWNADSSGLYYSLGSDASFVNVLGTLGNADATATPAALDGFYDLRRIAFNAVSTWFLWKDAAPNSDVSSSTDELATVSASLGSKTDGATSVRYVPSQTAPPAQTTPVAKAAITPFFSLNRTTVTTGSRVYYLAAGTYLQGPAYQGSKAVTWRGQVLYSPNASTAYKLADTSGADSAFITVGAADYNGYTQKLYKNTWFKLYFPGDYLTSAASIRWVKVTVSPTVVVSKLRSGIYTKVYGTVARQGGAAILYRYVSGKWVKLYTTTITSKGTYSFGYKSLPRGTYRVLSAADSYWGVGYRNFTI